MPRKKPFSNKQKKKQLQDKRERKRGPLEAGWSESSSRSQSRERREENTDTSDSESIRPELRRIHQQPQVCRLGEKGHDPNRYRLHFERESKGEIERRKKIAREKILEPVPETELEVKIETIYRPGIGSDFPKRPPWNYNMSKEAVLLQEEKSFKNFLQKIYERYKPGELSYFEHNLETWRQLWRVLEISDVLLLITDARHPVLHLSTALCDYVLVFQDKPLIIVLNKTDLVPPSVVTAWKHYFYTKYSEVHVVCFTSYPKDPEEEQDPSAAFKKRRKKRRVWSSALGSNQLLRACEAITAGKVDLSSWRKKIEKDTSSVCHPAGKDEEREDEESEDGDAVLAQQLTDAELGPPTRERYKDGVLSIGCLGFPNVGKSSFINGIVGKKVVSVSRTPGHTKYFQTYFLTPTVRLCDCPGLIFPSMMDKQQQILSGIYPIAQIQEPYTSVGYLASRIPIPKLLKLTHPEGNEQRWTAWDICEAWAEKRGYKTAKASRNDTYRAANSLLRLAVDGRLCVYLRPPDYSIEKEAWEQHSDTLEMMSHLQARGVPDSRSSSGAEEETSSSEEEDERDRDADEEEDAEEEDEEDASHSQAKKDVRAKIADVNPYALLGEDEC